ncbi:MAG TPA: hypothetical protein VNK24_06255 [Elusimicrobiota bacterium]|nr:hypothetical protein [Elusimicrobiota bacterium]
MNLKSILDMKTGRMTLLFALAAVVFAAAAPRVFAQEEAAEAPEAGSVLTNSPAANEALVPGGAGAGLSPDIGDFMESSAPRILPGASMRRSFAPKFLPSFAASPKTPPAAAAPSAPQALPEVPAAVPASVMTAPAEPVAAGAPAQAEGISPAGPPPLPAGSLEDFLVNAQNGQAASATPGFHPARTGNQPSSGKEGKSLLQRLLSPLELPAGKAAAASTGQAAQMGRADYDSHILGGAPSSASGSAENGGGLWARRLPASVPPKAAGAPSPAADPHPNQVMVALSLDLKKHPGEFRDALASLSSTARFKPAPGFAAGVPGAGMNGKIAVVGWLPRNEVPHLFSVPSVARVRVDWNPGPSSATDLLKIPGASARMIVGLRIPAGADPARVIAADLPRLRMESGFSYGRTIGYRTVRGSKDKELMVSGDLPLRGLSVAMGDADVLSVTPVPPPAISRASAGRSPGISGFLSYAAARSPGLFGLTALALVFSLAGF